MMKRIALDIFLLLLFLLEMSFQFLSVLVHEILGVILFAAVLGHLFWNRRWFLVLFQGKWNAMRFLSFFVNLGLLLSFLLTIVTGVIISNYLFRAVIPLMLHRHIMVQQLHAMCPYILLIFIGLHLGLHWESWQVRLMHTLGISKQNFAVRVGGHLLSLIIVAGGIYGSFLDQIGNRLRMQHIFATEASDLPWGIFLLVYLTIVGMYAVLSYYIQKIITHKTKPQDIVSLRKASKNY